MQALEVSSGRSISLDYIMMLDYHLTKLDVNLIDVKAHLKTKSMISGQLRVNLGVFQIFGLNHQIDLYNRLYVYGGFADHLYGQC